MAKRKTTVELDVEIGGVRTKLRTVKAEIASTGKAWTDMATKNRGQLRQLEGGLATTAVALAAVGIAAIASAARYEAAVSRMQAATNATAEQMDQLKAATQAAGREGVFSATEAADAVTELAKASVSAKDIISGGLDGALALAAAGELAVGQAAEFAASAMSQFKLEGSQIPHIADLLAAAAGKAQGEVSDAGMALSQVGLVAHNTGLSIEETTAAIAAMASAGAIGSDAGTSLKTMLMRLSGPTSEAAHLMNVLGIEAFDAQGNFVGLTSFAGSLAQGMSRLNTEQQNAALTTIFGSDAVRAASVIFQQGATGMQEWINSVNDSGYAAEVAATKNDNLLGDLKRLRGALEGLFINEGSGALVVLRALTGALTGLVNGFSELPSAVQGTVTAILLLVAGVTALSMAWTRVAPAMTNALNALANLGTAGTGAALGIMKVGSAMKGVMLAGGVIGIIAAVAFGVVELVKALEGDEKPASFEVDELAKSLTGLVESGAATGQLAEAYGANLEGFKTKVRELTVEAAALAVAEAELAASGESLENTFLDSQGMAGVAPDPTDIRGSAEAIAELTETLKPFDESLAALAQNGHADIAAASFARLEQSMIEAGMAPAVVASYFPQYTAAVAGLNTANTGLGQGFATTETKVDLLTGTMAEAIATGQTFLDVWNSLNGAAASFAEKEIAAEEGLDGLKKALEESGSSMDITTEKGRAAKSAMLDMAEAAAEAAKAKYEETGSIEDATAVYNGYIEQMRAMLLASGMGREEVERLIATYAKIPGDIFTDIDQNAKMSKKEIRDYISELYGIPDSVVTRIILQKEYQTAKAEQYDSRKGYADGGRINVGSGPRADDVPVMASRGEFIVNAASTAANLALLEHLNSGGQAPMTAPAPTMMPYPVAMPAQQSAGPMSLHVTFDTHGLGDAFEREMRRRLRITAAGNVQLGLGTRR